MNSEVNTRKLYFTRLQLMKIARDLYPQEISIVIAESGGYYSVF
jgi:hypothetical protein